ncbi:MAG: hypothetical protein K8U03_10020 [Planctomycetia bacterium]|nr:hypothetical protein [Planctomycetia bacterium]
MSSPFSLRMQIKLVALASALCVPLACGCTQALITGIYLTKGVETPAEFKELKGKKTAVVCRPLVELQYSSSSAAQRLAGTVSLLLKKKVKKIELIGAQKIEQWTDEHEWQEFSEVGKAVKSDYVVGIEIEEFKLYQGQTIYQGRARVHVTVHDMSKDGELVYEKNLPEIVYPPQAGIPTSEKPEEEFRRQFIGVVAEQVGRLFYGYDHRKDYAVDSTAL